MSNDRIQELTRELELARAQIAKQDKQLAILADDRREFLDNMSRELRTPLNSMLILARLLADNAEGNLTPKQVGFSATIHHAGTDLLNLINEILELAEKRAV